MTAARIKDAALTALIAALLALPFAGVRTSEGMDGLGIVWRLQDVGVAAALVFMGRLALGLIGDGHSKLVAPVALLAGIAALLLDFPTQFLKGLAVAGAFVVAGKAGWDYICEASLRRFVREKNSPAGTVESPARLREGLGEGSSGKSSASFTSSPPASGVGVPAAVKEEKSSKLDKLVLPLLVLALIFPLTPLASRYALDVAIMVLTYIMMAWGLNITVGYAGLLDLGYAGFYALGAYGYALLAQHTGMGFWTALPVAGGIAALTALVLGFPVLRLRGDYFAVVTLGFGEIVRLVLINWTNLTNGPNGISGIPRPQLFNLEFARTAAEGNQPFHEFFGIEFAPVQRVVFLYYIILVLALGVGFIALRLRRLPLGRAWEAFREDEIACAALGINRWWIKLAAYSLGALVAGLAGAFFATRQGFISPESFTFTESATILAITVLGGMGHPLGIVFAAAFIIGMPELFRELEQYRMLAFGAGMVLIMIWRPGGLTSDRTPTILLEKAP